MGYIYLINEFGTDNYKIGVTNSTVINKRKLELQTGNSLELIVCRTFTTEHPYKLEKMLHRHYSANRLLGEWFTLDDLQSIKFIDMCNKYNDIIKFLIKENEFYLA